MNLIVLATYEAISDWDSASADDLLLAHGLLIRELRCPDKIGQSRIKQPEQFSNTSC